MSLLTGNVNKPSAKIMPSSREELEQLIDDKIKCVNPKPGDKVCFNWIDISLVDDMSYLFYGYYFNVDIDISEWNVSNVTDMRGMFAHSNFNGDISGWKDKVKKVKDMRWMFDGCPLENNPPEWYKEKK